MPIFYPDILDQKTAARTFTYGDKDVMLYALGVGMGRDPMDETELAFVHRHSSRLRCGEVPRQWPELRLKTAGQPGRRRSSHGASRTCGKRETTSKSPGQK